MLELILGLVAVVCWLYLVFIIDWLRGRAGE